MVFPEPHGRRGGAHRLVHLFCRIWTRGTAAWDARFAEISSMENGGSA